MGNTGEIEQHKIDAWLGDARADMTDDQYEQFCREARDIGTEEDVEADNWVPILQRILGEITIADMGRQLGAARELVHARMAALRWAVVAEINAGRMSESEVAREAGVDRMTVRKWLGKR